MDNSINPALFGDILLQAGENGQFIQISNLSAEFLPLLKVGQSAMLNVAFDAAGEAKAFLQVGTEKINVVLPDNFTVLKQDGTPCEPEQTVSIPVKIGAGKKLYPIKNSAVHAGKPAENAETLPEKNIVLASRPKIFANMPLKKVVSQNPKLPSEVSAVQTVKTVREILSQIEFEPLKLNNFIEKTLREFKAPESIVRQAVQMLRPLNVKALQTGADFSMPQNVLQPLKNVLLQVAGQQPETFDEIKPLLQQEINNLSGLQIKGEISERVNDVTFVKTPLGETFFSSKVKLPVAENILLGIEAKVQDLLPEIKLLDDIVKIFHHMSKPKVNITPEFIAKQPQLKNLAAIDALMPEALPAIISKLPFQSENLVENIYRFYQGSVNQSLERWLGKDVLDMVAAHSSVSEKVVSELNGIMSNALKETPGWRIVEMPLFDGNQITPLKVALKKDGRKEKQKAGKNGSGTRFIVETSFSKLGSFQFDGFSSVERRSLDLILRTGTNLNDDFCANIINLFKKSLYSLNYAGTIKINRRQAFVSLYDENQINSGIYV